MNSRDKEIKQQRMTLEIMHALETLGIVEQYFADGDTQVSWRATGSEKRFDAVMAALRIE